MNSILTADLGILEIGTWNPFLTIPQSSCFVPPFSVTQQQNSTFLYPFIHHKKWGYINLKGE